MLKRVISDIAKQFFAKKVSSLHSSQESKHSNSDVLLNWQLNYSTASGDEKSSLIAKLNAWLVENPTHKQGHVLLGDWLQKKGMYPAAENAYRTALRIDPISPSAQEGLGLTLLHVSRLDEAYLHLEMAHKLQPMNSEVLTHWGLVALEMGNLSDAYKKFEKAIERDVNNAHAWHNLALVFMRQGNYIEGIQHFKRALSIKPDFGFAYSNLALAYREIEAMDDAIASAHQACNFKPKNARAWVVLADLLTDAGQFDDAHIAITKAKQLDPKDIGANIAAAKLATNTRNYAHARQEFQSALEKSPNQSEAKGGLGQLELLLGDYATGWRNYEYRRQTRPTAIRDFGLIDWAGTFESGMGLLVFAEQGLGDIILFASYLPSIIQKSSACGLRIVLETEPRLVKLFSRSFPEISVISRTTSLQESAWLADLSLTHQVPIGSLPFFLQQDQLFPFSKNYLCPSAERVTYWKEKMQELGPHKKIGITWRGGLLSSAGVQRSLPLTKLLTALDSTSVRLISLQHGEVVSAVTDATQKTGVDLLHWPEYLADLDEVAALTCALDAVVTVCNTQAHLTGALGQNGVVLVPNNPNWRYLAEGTRMPWYPSLQLIRQPPDCNWDIPLTETARWTLDSTATN